jgi:hypothetical protein
MIFKGEWAQIMQISRFISGYGWNVGGVARPLQCLKSTKLGGGVEEGASAVEIQSRKYEEWRHIVKRFN